MTEAEKVLAGEALRDWLPLTPDKMLSYGVQPTNKHSHFETKNSTCKLFLFINKQDLSSEISERPSKKGIIFEHQVGASKMLVSLEIDLKKKR